MIIDCFDTDSNFYKEMMNIILNAKRVIHNNGHVHHIIPRCYFIHYNLEVDNSIANTVTLTYDEHVAVHKLAYKCAKEPWLKSKLACAAKLMGDKEADYIVEDTTKQKIGEKSKERWSNADYKARVSQALRGKLRTAEQREHYKHKKSQETIEKMKLAAKARIISDETRKRMSEAHKGVPLSDSHKMAMKNGWKKKKEKAMGVIY